MSIAAENSTEIIAVKEKKNSNQTIFFMFKNTLKLPDLLKISQIILSCPLADCFEFRAFLASRFLCSQNIKKYSNKPAKGYERIIQRFSEDLTNLVR